MKYILSFISIAVMVGCADPGDATKGGAAGGGALGAGLGALIGSQTGDAGGGLVIGALAGAGTGAAVGNAFDARDNAMKTQDEAIERQDQILRAQKKEILELREVSQDSIQYSNSEGGPRASFKDQNQKSNTRRVPVAYLRLPEHLRQNKIAQQNHVEPVSQVRSATESEGQNEQAVRPTFYGKSMAPTDETPSLREQNILLDDAPSYIEVTKRPEADLQEKSVPPVDMPPVEQVRGETRDVYKMEGDVDVTSRLGGEGNQSEECRNAQNEVRQASSADDVADKLFHYRRALRLCPGNASYHSGLGDLYLSLKRTEDARFEFQEALRLDPSDNNALSGIQALASAQSESSLQGGLERGGLEQGRVERY